MNLKTQVGKVIGKSLNDYNKKLKPIVDDIKFKEEYQGRIFDCMVGEVDDNYIETPITDNPIVKLENSREGVVRLPSIKGKTILVDSEGNETDTPSEGCRLVSVGEQEDNKLIILSKNIDGTLQHKSEILLNEPLRSLNLSNYSVYDEILKNKHYRKIGMKKLTPSEYVGDFYFVQTNGFYRINSNYDIIDDIKAPFDDIQGIHKARSNLYVNGIPLKYMYNWNVNEFHYYTGNSTTKGTVFMIIEEEKIDKYSSIDKRERIRRYFEDNEIWIIYELEEPIIEEFPNSINIQGFNDTTMYIENSIVPTVLYGYNALIPFKEEISIQKQEVEINTLDIENNIIPYLMDIEFNLMLMEDI